MDQDSPTKEQIRHLVDSRNRTILDFLDDAGGSLHVEELAERLVSDDVTMVDSSVYEEQLERVLISLHHNRLPKLTEVGLVAYDHETSIVTSRASVISTEEVQNETIITGLAEYLQTSSETAENQVEVIIGRESIIQYGRQLADEAEEEIFCMYTNPDLLEEACIHHGEQALNRGVQMCIGSQNSQVRDLTRKHLSKATIWEPQLDVLNTSSSPRLGRIVLIDRRKVLLGILDEPDADGTHPKETALVGEGKDHPLVVLVRELLGPRIDHLDYQSDDFRSGTPYSV
jgi:hypothetical protein